jgi:hypothetical protein
VQNRELAQAILELRARKARKSHLDFMTFAWRGLGQFTPGFHTRKICERIDRAFEDYRQGRTTYLLINVHHRAGKALQVDTPIPTPSGYSRIIDLTIGDEIFNEHGEICRVLAKSPVYKDRDCYAVHANDGEIIIADGEHEWVTRQCRHEKKFLRHTTEWLGNRTCLLRSLIATQRSLQLPDRKLLIDPYVFGLWLGDGRSNNTFITSGVNEDQTFINNEIVKAGYKITPHKDKRNTSIMGILIKLRELNLLNNKHIPMEYKRSSISQRMALLQGLIDTDGYVDPRRGLIEFCNVNKTLAEDVQELVSSLGVKCSLNVGDATINGRFISKKYRVMFYMENAARLPRKRQYSRNGTRQPGRYIDVHPYGKADTVCIQTTSPSGMFLCGKTMLPTHNSDIVSRYLGPHFLGEFSGAEVMQVSYAADKATEFSAFARGVIESPRYGLCYPGLVLSTDTNRKDHYLTDKGGGLMATGLQGHMTGSGYALGILDDYCSGRAEAESAVQRDNAWNAFKDDFMTRIAPVGIVLVLATWWNIDDITGRILKAMKADPEFPRFEVMQFPAKATDYKGDGEYPSEYLFEERYPKTWYRTQYATLGRYSAAAILDCNPQPRTGGRLNVEHIEWYDEPPKDKKLSWVRVWDLAHTAKQRGGDDPDWTSGTYLAFERRAGDPVPHLWVDHVMRTRDDATERDAKIKTTARMDGPRVRQGVESSLDSKDAYPYLKRAMPELSWYKINIHGEGDKAMRATPLEPIFEASGHVHVRRGEWNDAWLDEIMRFDGLTGHDDQVDNLSAGYIMQMGKRMRAGQSAAALGL